MDAEGVWVPNQLALSMTVSCVLLPLSTVEHVLFRDAI